MTAAGQWRRWVVRSRWRRCQAASRTSLALVAPSRRSWSRRSVTAVRSVAVVGVPPTSTVSVSVPVWVAARKAQTARAVASSRLTASVWT
ncbi:hypothetical protein BBK82_29440 [Lentzea guizhouensis]|uniref:Uncharacterized protein n=1 Tax=Lentzea guizhouensis TaxID=1586287 RepID=A0A1B2HPE9_9PSEU|nr:hypothetical protein BBK82_29440 [Lentzea guizhouensis]